jgi:hypothetical protein
METTQAIRARRSIRAYEDKGWRSLPHFSPATHAERQAQHASITVPLASLRITTGLQRDWSTLCPVPIADAGHAAMQRVHPGGQGCQSISGSAASSTSVTMDTRWTLFPTPGAMSREFLPSLPRPAA